jgi:hypothetical protein
MTNTRILLDLCHPRLGDVIPVPPPPLPLAAKNVIGDGPVRQPIGTQDGEGGAANQSIQDGQGLKSSLQSRCRSGGGSTRCTTGSSS